MAEAGTSRLKGTRSGPRTSSRMMLCCTMMLIRRFEEKAAEMYARGKIRGFLHLYIGQEAVAVGAISALRPTTTSSPLPRARPRARPRRSSPNARDGGALRRRPASAAAAAARCTSSTSRSASSAATPSSAAHMPLACGLALRREQYKAQSGSRSASRRRRRERGRVPRGAEPGGVWKLPVLFICENNLYGMGTAVRPRRARRGLQARRGLRHPAEQVDGMDVLPMHEATREALKLVAAARARSSSRR